MKLRKVDDRIWVNVGIGNVTSVVDISAYERQSTLINFLSGGQIEVTRPVEAVVKALYEDGGFGR